MVSPLVAYVELEDYSHGGSWSHHSKFYRKRTGYRQAPPYNIDTSMNLVIRKTSPEISARHHLGVFGYDEAITEATNLARKRFVDELGSSSSFGASMTAELKQTWGTVVSGITTTLLAARAVKKGDLVGAAKILGFTPPVVSKSIVVKRRRRNGTWKKKTVKRQYWRMPTGREVWKDLANRWLWFSYGIKPLVSDIHNGMDVLTREIPTLRKVKGSGSAVKRNVQSNSSFYAVHHVEASVRFKAEVSVTNPNLWLANQLGLVNPVQMFNEGIPFSFVIDWFSNLSDIIMQMTDFVGLKIASPNLNHKVSVNYSHQPLLPKGQAASTFESFSFSRSKAVPQAKLRFAYERFSWQRGANAASLLIGLLRKSG